MRSIFVVLLGILVSSSGFAATWDFSCNFSTGGKERFTCSATGFLTQIETIAPTVVNRLVVTCENDFEFTAAQTRGSLASANSLLITSAKDELQAIIEMEDFLTQGGDFESTLQFKDQNRTTRPIPGECRVSFTSS